MITRATFALTAVVGCLPFAVAVDPPMDDAKKLEGVWKVVGMESKGQKHDRDGDSVKTMQAEVKGDHLTFRWAERPGSERKKTFTLDPGPSPKWLDLTSLDGHEKGTTAACIYKLDKNRFTICVPYWGKDPTVRPKEFKADADDGNMVFVMERLPAK